LGELDLEREDASKAGREIEPLILVADDEPEVLVLIRDALAREPWDIDFARDGREALQKLTSKTYDLAVLDLKMPHLDGMEVLKSLRDRGISTDVLILTGHGTISIAVLAMKLGARDFITKPFQVDEFKQVIQNLLERRRGSAQTLPERLDAYLQRNAFNPDLHLEDLCKHFGISSRYISRLFRDNYGVSFRKRLAFFRVERAKELLRSTDDPLYRIADRCGFNDYRQLTKTFQRVEQISPKEYRLSYKEGREI
jgi:YesN/AraC family two-component response regulator